VLVLGGVFVWSIFNNKTAINQEIKTVTEEVNTPLNNQVDDAQKPEDQNIIKDNKPQASNKVNTEITSAVLETSQGNITVEFFSKDAPKTVANFIDLAKKNFYDGIKFHRVIKGFMIQGGDPLTKDDTKAEFWGTGGPGYKFEDEIDAKSDLYTKIGYKKGILAMANSGPNTNGSQFFIMHTDYPLPPLYTIFGKVTAGQDVVDKIANVETGQNDRPVNPVVILNVTLK